jgi:hypothetical protein
VAGLAKWQFGNLAAMILRKFIIQKHLRCRTHFAKSFGDLAKWQTGLFPTSVTAPFPHGDGWDCGQFK